jgi:hypothetical protein
MTDVQALIRAQAALKRSEAYERAGDLTMAHKEAEDAVILVEQWRNSLFNAALANLKKAA